MDTYDLCTRSETLCPRFRSFTKFIVHLAQRSDCQDLDLCWIVDSAQRSAMCTSWILFEVLIVRTVTSGLIVRKRQNFEISCLRKFHPDRAATRRDVDLLTCRQEFIHMNIVITKQATKKYYLWKTVRKYFWSNQIRNTLW